MSLLIVRRRKAKASNGADFLMQINTFAVE